MIVKAWNNGSYDNSGIGYGIKISKSDRKLFFDTSWDKVIVNIGNIENIENNEEIPIRDTFWTTCPELRSVKIGEYLVNGGLDKWEKYKPYKLLLFPQDDNEFILIISKPKKLATWAEGSNFRYDGCIEIGTRIYFGETGSIEISKQQYKLLLKEFSGLTIDVGTSRNRASTHSLGYWLQNNITKTAIACYIGRILLQEGYAEKNEGSMIKFN